MLLLVFLLSILSGFLSSCDISAIGESSITDNTTELARIKATATIKLTTATPTKPASQSVTPTTVVRTTETSAEMTAEPTAEPTAAPTEGPTPSPTPATTRKPTPTATPEPTQAPLPPYYLYAEKGSFALVVYGLDEHNKYNQIVRVMIMAIGRGTMTPSGKFKLTGRERWHVFSSTVHAQYAIRYSGSLYIHGPLYKRQNIHNLKAESYTSIGTKDTSGCLRLTSADAYWIYTNCVSGTILEIESKSPRNFTPPALPPITTKGDDPTDPLIVKPTPAPTATPTPSSEPTPEPTPEPTSTDERVPTES